MEKIYMDNNSPQKGLDSKHHISIILSFIVAVFAIVSLIAVGFNQISFAAPNDEAAANSSFKLATFKKGIVDPMTEQTTVKPVSINSYSSVQGNNGYKVPIMYVDINNETPDINNITPVFCIGKKSDQAGVGLDYSSGGAISDNGIAYILSRSRVYSGNDDVSIVPKGTGGANYMYLEIYATQVALWMYTGDESVSQDINNIRGENGGNLVYSLADPNNNPIQSSSEYFTGNLYPYIAAVVEGAQREDYTSGKSINVTIGENISDVEGTNFFQSSLVQVTPIPNEDFISYDLSLEGVEGVVPITEDGKEIENLTGLSVNDKFYLRIPKDKVSEGTHDINIYVTGHFSNAQIAFRYLNDGHQDIVRLEKGNIDVYGSEKLTILPSPNTGASTSQTIYFIGLVVLLCGVGIIYANSKAIKNV